MKTAVVLAVASAVLASVSASAAVPAGPPATTVPPGYNGQTNPGVQNAPTTVPPGYNGQTNPGSINQPSDVPSGTGGPDPVTPPTPPASPRALGITDCGQFKTAFATNRSAFGKCVVAVAKTLETGETPAVACKSLRLGRAAHDSSARSAFRACVKAAAAALRASS